MLTTPFDSGDQKLEALHGDSPNYRRRARVSFVLAVICLAVGVVCIMYGQWPPGIILVLAAVAGVMTARQLRTGMKHSNTDR